MRPLTTTATKSLPKYNHVVSVGSLAVLAVLGVLVLSQGSSSRSTTANGGQPASLSLRTSAVATAVADCPKDAATGYSTALAYQQSFGFFTDILDSAWIRMQKKAIAWQQYKNPDNPMQDFQNAILWYVENLQPDFTCPDVHRVGGHDDGPKWTCHPHRIAALAKEAKNKKQKQQQQCLIYSIGSAGKYQWEDALVQDYFGGDPKLCEIHVFDPGNFARAGDPEQKGIHYHAWGLGVGGSTSDGGADGDNKNNKYNNAGYKPDIYSMGGATGKPVFKSFAQTLQELGHEGRTIDILKIDCENCEWVTYKDWISRDIRQILIETHGVPNPNAKQSQANHGPLAAKQFFDAFRNNGYVMFSKEPNVKARGSCIEFSYLKLHSDFWKATA